MRDQSSREPSTKNVEGSPTLVYEVWDWVDSDKHWKPLAPEACHWRFIGYRTLTLRQVLKYTEFGYLVERSPYASRNVGGETDDRGRTSPLFPRMGSAPLSEADRVDAVPLPEPGPS